jgi:DNA-3-methyladenine glycosylase II
VNNKALFVSEVMSLAARSPFDFAKSLDFLGGFVPSEGGHEINGGVLTKALRVDGQTIVFSARQSVIGLGIDVTLHSDEPLAENIQQAALDRITTFLSLEDDLAPLYAASQDDPAFAPVVARLYGYHQVRFVSPLENVIWAMLSARNGYRNANSAQKRLLARFGSSLSVNGTRYVAYPSAADLLAASDQDLLDIARQDYRARFLESAVLAFEHVDEAWLLTAPYDDVYAWLRGIHGIGEWTASFIMIRSLGRMERLIAPEQPLIEIVARRYGVEATAKAVWKLAVRYGQQQAYWAHYLRAAG